jgi:hypothetical protein
MSASSMTKQAVYDTVRSALARLFSSEDLLLLEDDVNERSVSHRLAIHLEREIKDRGEAWTGLHVDCEYNRDFTNPKYPYSKKLNLPARYDVSNEDTHALTVFPDIIVHRRRSTANFVVIEIKKQGGNPDAEEFDRNRKLPAYLTELGYRFGVFLVLGVGGGAGAISEFSILERTESGITITTFR